MPLLWLVLAAISIFMFLLTMTEISGHTASFLAIGWFVIFVITIFEAGGIYLTARHKPTRKEQDAAYWEETKRRRGRYS